MKNAKRPIATFNEGEEVVLTHGGNQGTPGTFVRLRADPRWADVLERTGVVKSHPVEWLERAKNFKYY